MAGNLLAKDFLVVPFARHKGTTILRVINMAIPCPRTYITIPFALLWSYS